MKYFEIYREMMDSFLFISFNDIRFRTSIKQDLNDDGNSPPYFDRSFSRISNFIINSKENK